MSSAWCCAPCCYGPIGKAIPQLSRQQHHPNLFQVHTGFTAGSVPDNRVWDFECRVWGLRGKGGDLGVVVQTVLQRFTGLSCWDIPGEHI